MFQSSGGKKHDDNGTGKEKESHKERKRRIQLSAMKSDIEAREKELNDVRQKIADAKKMIYDLTNQINDATANVNTAKQAYLLALVKTTDVLDTSVESDSPSTIDNGLPGERKDLRLTTLPRPVLKRILVHVGIRELGRLSQCCRYLSSVCADDSVWEAHIVNTFSDYLYYGGKKAREKQQVTIGRLPRSTSDCFSPEVADEPMADPFDKSSATRSTSGMSDISDEMSSPSTPPSNGSDQSMHAVLSPRIGINRRDRKKIQSLLFVKPPVLDPSIPPQLQAETRMRTSSQTGPVPKPLPSSDSSTPRGPILSQSPVAAEQPWHISPMKNSSDLLADEKANCYSPIFKTPSSGDTAAIPIERRQSDSGQSSSCPGDQPLFGRTALDKLFGSGSSRHNVFVSVAGNATPMRRHAALGGQSSLIGSPLITTFGSISAKDRCKYAPCAYPQDRIDRNPNTCVVPQAKRVKINIVYSRVPSLFFRLQQQPSLMDLVYDYNPSETNDSATSTDSSSISPAVLAGREGVQSRLVRYTVYDDYDKVGPHPAVVQLNEMGQDVERCHTFLQVFFRNTNGVLIVYDASVDCAFSRISSVDMDLVHHYCAARNPQVFLLGYLSPNMECEVDLAEIHKYCISNNVCNLGVVSINNLSEISNAFACMCFRVLRSVFKQ